MKQKTILLTGVLFSIFGLLWSCSGNSGGGNGGSKVGYFVDGPVQGLMYITSTQAGETDADGAFLYNNGEVVSFLVGDILIGQASGASQLSPFDLAGATPPQTGIEVRRAVNEMKRTPKGSPFEKATNIAVFLQTLDDDGDLSNGIQIPAMIHQLAAGVSIDFNQNSWEFSDDISFRKLIADGRNAGLWGGSRALQKPANALDVLYAGLGIAPMIYAQSLLEVDSNADGTVDYRNLFTYDANGYATVGESDFNGDGTVDSRATFTYDASGNRTMQESDSNVDGTVDSRITYTYDANGNQTMQESDSNADGTVDSRITYTYDANGYRTMYEDDSNADGTINSRTTYTYDAKGNLTMYEADSNADGIVDSRSTYTYDASGNRTMQESDSNVDGIVDSRTSYTYDASGNRTMIESDNDANSTIDFQIIYTFDAEGYVTVEDITIGGTVYRQTYTYDANGNVTIEESDTNVDGTVDSHTTFTFDANGNQTMQETDAPADGTIDTRIMMTYQVTNGWSPVFSLINAAAN